VGSKRQGENFKCVMWMAAGGGESKRLKMKEKKCGGDKEKEVVVVEKKKTTNKESVSGTPGLRPQAHSVKACGWCLGPILGSMCDPAVEDHEAVAAWPVLTWCACSASRPSGSGFRPGYEWFC
jgi:hypothetical protein